MRDHRAEWSAAFGVVVAVFGGGAVASWIALGTGGSPWLLVPAVPCTLIAAVALYCVFAVLIPLRPFTPQELQAAAGGAAVSAAEALAAPSRQGQVPELMRLLTEGRELLQAAESRPEPYFSEVDQWLTDTRRAVRVGHNQWLWLLDEERGLPHDGGSKLGELTNRLFRVEQVVNADLNGVTAPLIAVSVVGIPRDPSVPFEVDPLWPTVEPQERPKWAEEWLSRLPGDGTFLEVFNHGTTRARDCVGSVASLVRVSSEGPGGSIYNRYPVAGFHPGQLQWLGGAGAASLEPNEQQSLGVAVWLSDSKEAELLTTDALPRLQCGMYDIEIGIAPDGAIPARFRFEMRVDPFRQGAPLLRLARAGDGWSS